MAGKPKGAPKTGGRKKGTPNKVTKSLREAIEASFDKVGGVTYLVQMAKEQPTAYLGLLGKILPAHMNIQTNDNTFRLVVERASAANPPSSD